MNFIFSCYSSVTDPTIKGLKAVDTLVQRIMGTDFANVHTEVGKHNLSVRDSHDTSSWVWHFLDIQYVTHPYHNVEKYIYLPIYLVFPPWAGREGSPS